jgi:hypothetical protein
MWDMFSLWSRNLGVLRTPNRGKAQAASRVFSTQQTAGYISLNFFVRRHINFFMKIMLRMRGEYSQISCSQTKQMCALPLIALFSQCLMYTFIHTQTDHLPFTAPYLFLKKNVILSSRRL